MTTAQAPLPRLLIILDLDETLLRATGNPTLDPPDFLWEDYRVRRRPGLTDFLTRVSQFADVGLWSSASDAYVRALVSRAFPAGFELRFAWGESRCTRCYDAASFETYWIKDLAKTEALNYTLDRVLIVDDTAEKIARHAENHVPIQPFYGDLNDRVLESLARYLETFATVKNVRAVEKRGWAKRFITLGEKV